MRARISLSALLLVFFPVLWILSGCTLSGHTRLELTEAGTGRKIFSALLRDGEEVVLIWKNSLFGLSVTEVFQAQRGNLVLTEVTFADPQGPAPPSVAPKDVDDLYQTGGPFSARGLTKPFKQVVYRVGEIGDPKLKVRDRVLALKEQVGFGGAVILTAESPRWVGTFFEPSAPRASQLALQPCRQTVPCSAGERFGRNF